MKRSILKEILFGITLLFVISTFLITWLANNYRDSMLDIEIDNFFVSSSIKFSENEAKFEQRLKQIKRFISKRLRQQVPKLSKKIHKALSSKKRVSSKVERISTFFIHKRLLEARKKYPYLSDQKLLSLQYNDLHKFWNIYNGIYLNQTKIDEHVKAYSSNSIQGQYSLASMLTSVYTKRIMGNKNVDYFYDSIKSMHGMQFDPSKPDFQIIEILGTSRQFLILGLEMDKRMKSELITHKKIVSTNHHKIYIGFLTCKLNLMPVYEKLPNVSISLTKSLKKFTKFETLNAANKPIGNSVKLEQFNQLLDTSEGSLRLRAFDSENRQFYINVIKESRYNKYHHIFIYEAHARYALYQQELKHYFIFYLLIVVSVVVIAIGIARALASPLTQLNELVQVASQDLKTDSLNKLNPIFMEIFVLKSVFISQIDNLRDEFLMSAKLVDFQEFLLERPEINEAKNQLMKIFNEFGEDEIKEKISQILDNNRSTDLQIDNEFYAEWCRYEDSIALERDYRLATQQKKEFRLAQDIQQQLLPIDNSLNKNVHCFYLAARYLGGDFYDLLEIDSKIYFLIADVSGKGLPSAIFGAAAKFFLSVQLNARKTLEHAMQSTNYYLCGLQQQGFFCTLFLASWNQKSRTLSYCSAGHNKMYLLSPTIQELNAKGLPLGFLDMANYKMGQIKDVPRDSLLVLYTDGVTEAENESEELFDNPRLEKLLLEYSTQSPSKISDALIKSLSDFTKDAEQSDDITYVLARL